MLETSSSLAFRSLLKTAAAKSGLAKAEPRLTGPTGAATAFHAAVIAQDSVLLLVVPTDADVERITGDARFFYSALKGLSDIETAGQVLPLPSQEVDPYRGLTPHFEVASARAQALHGLASGRARLVIASARAQLPRLSNRSRSGSNSSATSSSRSGATTRRRSVRSPRSTPSS
jgi:transcription-repair coupling factor (superfamily II helicase)